MASIPMPPGRSRKPVALLMAGALTLSLASGAGAANPAHWTKINACVNVKTHVVKIRTKRAQPTVWCAKDERLFSWAITGPQGPAGSTGADRIDRRQWRDRSGRRDRCGAAPPELPVVMALPARPVPMALPARLAPMALPVRPARRGPMARQARWVRPV